MQLALTARHRERLGSVAAGCEAAGVRTVRTYPVDLTRADDVAGMVAQIEADFGRVDVLVNNAGSWRGGAAHEMSVDEFTLVLQENLIGAFAVTRGILAGMRQRGSGDIFFVSSTSGLEGLANNSAYCAAKHGVAGLAKAVRAEAGAHGIRVCCVYPGATETPTWNGSGVDTSRLMSARDVAQTMVDAYRLSRRSALQDIVLRPMNYP